MPKGVTCFVGRFWVELSLERVVGRIQDPLDAFFGSKVGPGDVLGGQKGPPKAPWVPPRRLGGALGSPWGALGRPWPSLIPQGVPHGGPGGPLAPQRVTPRAPGGPPGGGQGALEGLKRAPKAALEETVGRRGDIAKSLFLLHEMVHFGFWRGTWAGPKATTRGGGHHMEPDDRAKEEKARSEGASLKNAPEKEDSDH